MVKLNTVNYFMVFLFSNKETYMIQTRINQKKRRRFRLKRFLLFVLIVMVLPTAFYFGFVSYKTYKATAKTYSQLERGSHSDLRDKEVTISKDPISILLIGLENYSTNYKGGHTDSLMVATFNPELKTMKLVSIPRDTYVYIDKKGRKDKITHAYGVGGADETIKAVETLLDIPIDYYVQVNFKGFKDVVNELGGVKVNVPFDFYEHSDSTGKNIYFEKGPAKLNGEKALAYARMRKQDPRGDFGRNDRQKELIKAILDKASSPNNVLKIDKIAERLEKNITTNLTMSQPLYFFKKYKGFPSKNIETLKIAGTDDYINDIYYFIPSEESLSEVQKQLQTHLEYKKAENKE
ncbi:LCP family protein [Neobacillus cucumis]|uniref:LCP family protein n=1 Tax=Neobacillus cucumis TaxID=1740721 RepID=UPI00203FE5B7|nr:LCP family protein [Neobacillus cucumis]MCM3727690.1 LCP family protein [Neobacillus cucumis]